MAIRFTPADPADAEALVALRIEAMRESLERIGRFNPQRARERFLATFDPALTRHIVLDQLRVGFMMATPNSDHLFLNHLYVLPSHQGRGIGAWALGDLLAEADSLGLPVRVGALRESASNRFYVRHGFMLTHEEEFDLYYVRDPS